MGDEQHIALQPLNPAPIEMGTELACAGGKIIARSGLHSYLQIEQAPQVGPPTLLKPRVEAEHDPVVAVTVQDAPPLTEMREITVPEQREPEPLPLDTLLTQAALVVPGGP